MTKVIGVIAIKGGVGKTTIASSLATDLVNHYGKKVLLVDGNYSAPNLGIHMDIVNPEKTVHDVLAGKARIQTAAVNKFGVDVVAGSHIYHGSINPLKLKDKINKIKENYDFVIIDSSPALNEEVLSVMQASDNLLVVTTPDYPTLIGSLRAAIMAKQRGKPISGMILNKIRDPKYELTMDEIEGATEIPIVARIPDDKNTNRALFTKIPVSIYNRNSSFSKEISKLSAALTNNSVKKGFWRSFLGMDFKREEMNRELLKESFYTSIIRD
jgi:septum site-determining protein MinD